MTLPGLPFFLKNFLALPASENVVIKAECMAQLSSFHHHVQIDEALVYRLFTRCQLLCTVHVVFLPVTQFT